MRKIYLSLPINGYDYQERKAASLEVQREMEKRGYEVSNPMFNGLAKDALRQEHMRTDFKMLCECDEIVMLPKWDNSAGCLQELAIAASIGCKVRFILSLSPLVFVESRF